MNGQSAHLTVAAGEMKSFTQHFTEEHFSLTLTVVLLALFFSLVVGEALVLGVSLKVGIGVAVAVFFVQIIFFGELMETPFHSSRCIPSCVSLFCVCACACMCVWCVCG